MDSKIQAVEKWDNSEELIFPKVTGIFPTIMEDRGDKYWLRRPVFLEKLFDDWEEPKENVEIVSTFRGWLNYLTLPKCHYCNKVTSEEYVCEGGCGELYCEDCSAQLTYHSFIEKNCCASCQESIKWREYE